MQAIIFDFGNVVAFFDHYRTLNRLAAYTHVPLERIYADIYQGELEDAFERGALTPPQFLKRMIELACLRCDEQFLSDAIADIFWANPEVCELIPKLKKRHRIVLGSNTNVIHSNHFREQFADLLSHFDGLVLSHDIGVRKPKPAFFQECRRLANAPADQCLFIDDLPANIESAKEAGLHGILYKPGNDLFGKLRAAGVEV
jgi:HAD superfamily hydrolase (TIGR01509 family)